MMVVPRVAFLPTLLFTLAMNKVAGRPWYSRMDDTVILGAMPFTSTAIEITEKEGVTGVVTMNEEFETRYLSLSKEDWSKLGVEQLRLDTMDIVEAPSVEKCERGVDFITRHGRNGGSVYVHCKAGQARSATVVACYLMTANHWTPEQAVNFMTKKRPAVFIRSQEWTVIRQYHADNVEI